MSTRIRNSFKQIGLASIYMTRYVMLTVEILVKEKV